MQLRCNKCGTVVSTWVPDNTVVGAWVECVDCVQADERFETLRKAAQGILDNPPCHDFDCCERGHAHTAAEEHLEKVLEDA